MRDPRGAISKLTPEFSKVICRYAAEKRVFDSQVAIAHNLHPDTLKNWMKWGLLPDAQEPYLSFAMEYAKVLIADEASAIADVLDGAKEFTGDNVKCRGDWKAAAWYLERKYPRRWNPNKQAPLGPTESLDVEALLVEAAGQHESLTDLLRDPTPQLVAALTDAREEIQALFATFQKALPAGTTGPDGKPQ